MLTRLAVHNFKRFEDVDVELGNPVVLVGPNDSGKTSAMQALALWSVGLRRWNEKRAGSKVPAKRPGVVVNRLDLTAVPVPSAKLLWQGLRTRNVVRMEDGKPSTSNVRIDITVSGLGNKGAWECGFEFDYANEESVYCRPMRLAEGRNPERMPVPEEAGRVQVAFLPPMSGLAANEARLDEGALNVRVGEGRTAEVLRNLCYRVWDASRVRDSSKGERESPWESIVRTIHHRFKARLSPPLYVAERGEIKMSYKERDIELDLSSAGRGLQQTLLLLSYMYANPGAVLLLDEPDAHLEILRQRDTYRLLTETAEETGSQVIAASHSEVILNEAGGRDMVIAFVGEPHRMDTSGQVVKALRDIGFDHYYQAEQAGWVLYLEGSTDLEVLRTFAERLSHESALRALERPFVNYVGNQPTQAQHHFRGLREALPKLRAVAVFDNLDEGLPNMDPVECFMWERREIENYVATRSALEAYAEAPTADVADRLLFDEADRRERLEAMRESIDSVAAALNTLGKPSPWDVSVKASDDFLTPLFKEYHERLGLYNVMPKRSFHVLARHVPADDIDPQVVTVLGAIGRTGAGSSGGWSGTAGGDS